MWGHAYEFERDHAWTLMETLAGMLGGHADIWYATNIEIFSYIADYRSWSTARMRGWSSIRLRA